MIFPEVEKERIIHTIGEDDTYAEYTPGDDDLEGDWDDEEDESFDDMAEDREDLHDIIVEEDIYDEDDDDHLPEEDI
jgi:hypothetical protein